VDHLLYDWTKLQREKEKLKCNVLKQDKLLVNKSDLVNKYTKHFVHFTNSIDFEKLWTHQLSQTTVNKHSNINTNAYMYTCYSGKHKRMDCTSHMNSPKLYMAVAYRGVVWRLQPPPPEIPKFWQSQTGLQIERQMFSVPVPTS
jgi:hypothetical protein